MFSLDGEVNVVHAIQSFFNSGRLLGEVNVTIIPLVHKVSNPSSVGRGGIIDQFFFLLKYNL